MPQNIMLTIPDISKTSASRYEIQGPKIIPQDSNINLSSYLVYLRIKETIIPINTPIKTDPSKIPKKSPIASRITISEKSESL